MTDYNPGDLVEVTATRERWTVDEVQPARGIYPVRLILGRSYADENAVRGTARDAEAEEVTLVCRAAERTVFPGSSE